MIPPFSPGSSVRIGGRTVHRVDSCVAVDGGLYLLRLVDVSHDEATVWTVEIKQNRVGVWMTEDLEGVTAAADGAVERGPVAEREGELF